MKKMRLRDVTSFSQDHRVKDEVRTQHILVCVLGHYLIEG